ncbi:MAG: hypothetical protein FWH38_04990, partial [Treponema sp.]|nr:hypothetical protein [Treponema sp.]
GGKALDRVLVTSGEPHQNSRWNDPALNDPDSAQYLDIIAYHIYGSLDSRYPLALNMGKETWMTEHNINSQNESLYLQDSTWNYVWLVADEIHQVIANNDSSAFIWWYAKRFYSFIGDGSYGTINGAVLPRGYVLSHYAKYATDTVRVGATLSSHPSAANVRVSAYQRKTDKNTDNEKKVEANEDSISLVLYDKRTTPAAPTDIKINLPSGFTATGAYGIISDDIQKHAPVLVVLAQDGNSAVVTLPANTIISLKFTK